MARTADPGKRNAILLAARTVFLERGYVQTRMSDIAERAGVATGTLYLYFDSKEALVLALSEQFFETLAVVITPATQQQDTRAAIAESVRLSLAHIVEHQDLLRLTRLDAGLAGALRRPLPARREYHARLATQLAWRMTQGQMRRYDPLVLAELITGMVERAAEVCLIYGGGDTARYEVEVVRMLQQALLPYQEESP
ncbi:MAG TPA: helix-turn-helix domain-containing protein [Roseiflexaceae bacterium]|nr:helix-turn-helix domain-containing protein [Roseiflexaceae bacterium]